MEPLYITMTNDTTIELPQTLNLTHKGVALMDISGYYSPQLPDRSFYLCCDFIEPSILQGNSSINLYPVLRSLFFNKSGKGIHRIRENYTKLLFLPCNRDEVQLIRLYLIDDQGNLASFEDCHLKCTLLIIPHHGSRTKSR